MPKPYHWSTLGLAGQALAGAPCPELTLDEVLADARIADPDCSLDLLEGHPPKKEERKTTMDLQIQTTETLTNPWTAWFLYGATGSGKTRAAASFPDPLFLVPANEGSELTLAQLKDRKIPFIKIGRRADGTSVPARAHLTEILDELTRRHTLMRQALAKGDEEAAYDLFPWQTIVAESLTHLGDMLVEDVSLGGARKMDQQGWGLISSFMRTLHSRLKGFDCHVVYTSLAKTQDNESGGIAQGGPNLIGQTADKLPSSCDVIAYMEELPGQGKDAPPIYRAFFRRYRWWAARTRFGGFPQWVDNFDYQQLAPMIGASQPE